MIEQNKMVQNSSTEALNLITDKGEVNTFLHFQAQRELAARKNGVVTSKCGKRFMSWKEFNDGTEYR